MSKNAKRKREEMEKKNQEDCEVIALAKKMHIEMFFEEYDFIYDSTLDSQGRKRGINPMSEKYQKEVAAKREKLGVSPLSKCGSPTSDDTMQWCIREDRKIINNKLD